MCGIIAVVRRPSDRPIPAPSEIEALLDESARALVVVLERPLAAEVVELVVVAAERAVPPTDCCGGCRVCERCSAPRPCGRRSSTSPSPSRNRSSSSSGASIARAPP